MLRRRPRPLRRLDAGPFQAEVDSFRLHLAAEAKAARTVAAYTGAARWFAAGHLLTQTDMTRWEQVDKQDVQRWMVHLLGRYSAAYASIQFRSLQQFFKWLAAEAGIPDPMAGLRQPAAVVTAVPVFTSVELSRLEAACKGGSFAQRRDAAIIATFRATGLFSRGSYQYKRGRYRESSRSAHDQVLVIPWLRCCTRGTFSRAELLISDENEHHSRWGVLQKLTAGRPAQRRAAAR